MEENPAGKKISFTSGQDMSALMAMGLPPEVLSTLTSIKQEEKKSEEITTKKVVIEQKSQDLSHLHGMGLPDEVIQTLRGIKSEDFKTQKAQQQAKEAQVLAQMQAKAMPPELKGLKFNPLTGGFNVPQELVDKLNINQNQAPQMQVQESKTQYQSKQDDFNLPKNTEQVVNFDSLLGNTINTSIPIEKPKEEPKPEITFDDILKLASAPKVDTNTISSTPTIENTISDSFSLPTISLDSLVSNTTTNLFDLLNVTENKPIENKPTENTQINVSQTVNYTESEKTEINSALVRSLQVSEEGVFIGIILNITKKPEAIDILNKQCKTQFPTDYIDNIIGYEKEGITLYVEDDIVTQIEFKRGFEGSTSKGLKIGDNLEKAIELYGKPTMKTPKGAVWRNFKIFYDKEVIHSIKIQR
ncbi:MAG: hypothetical protein U0457_01295 [Candidatus Sericytochromatia bacterium]